jgi:hypothetical protein
MHRTTFRSIAVLAAFVFAALAFAQSADKNTAGPTANQLQLRLTEPAEGATITGNQVRVTVAYNQVVFGQGQGTKFGEANFPQPTVDILLDNDLKKTVKGTEANVVFLDDVPAGSHNIIVIAKNVSGEVIDRKQVNITTTPAVAEAPATTSTTTYEARTAPVPPPPPAPAIEAPAPPPPPAPAMEMEQETLPKTGSAYPRVAAVGLALALAGLTLARKAR